ncbi:hypothetical protein [Lutimonas zeaxanthinifaciens]|uniref:hypothetical protein n=1 Tax=Lutimonas zeaxanthinifaciens TaxID=3060215 RepID=UPI00265CD8CA|nr:hypothetical protein [Lutimonas sp. YSD2104]WKK66008.1 hypothetical protein QZH61_15645 [Lutimonas sp. YSD2104]
MKKYSPVKVENALAYILLIVGVLNIILFIDTILTDSGAEYEFLSVATNQTINSIFYGSIAAFLLIAGNKMLKKKLNT